MSRRGPIPSVNYISASATITLRHSARRVASADPEARKGIVVAVGACAQCGKTRGPSNARTERLSKQVWEGGRTEPKARAERLSKRVWAGCGRASSTRSGDGRAAPGRPQAVHTCGTCGTVHSPRVTTNERVRAAARTRGSAPPSGSGRQPGGARGSAPAPRCGRRGGPRNGDRCIRTAAVAGAGAPPPRLHGATQTSAVDSSRSSRATAMASR